MVSAALLVVRGPDMRGRVLPRSSSTSLSAASHALYSSSAVQVDRIHGLGEVSTVLVPGSTLGRLASEGCLGRLQRTLTPPPATPALRPCTRRRFSSKRAQLRRTCACDHVRHEAWRGALQAAASSRRHISSSPRGARGPGSSKAPVSQTAISLDRRDIQGRGQCFVKRRREKFRGKVRSCVLGT